MTNHDTDHDDVLRDLEAALDVEPSHAFADGVRARVTRSRAHAHRMWWGLAAAASLVLGTMALWRPSMYAPAIDAPVKVAVAPAQTTAPAVPGKAPESVVAMVPVTPPAVTRREATVARTTAARTTVASTEPRLEVITNQGALLRQLWASAGSGAMVETEAEVAVPVSAVEVKPIAPIVLDPIVVPPIVVTEIGKTPGGAGATPVIRRAEATKDATKETR